MFSALGLAGRFADSHRFTPTFGVRHRYGKQFLNGKTGFFSSLVPFLVQAHVCHRRE
jgi:hypothetical protein